MGLAFLEPVEMRAVKRRERRAPKPWVIVKQIINRNAVVANVARDGRTGDGRNRVAVGNFLRTMTQGSSCLATLGFGTESRWDSRMVRAHPDTAPGAPVSDPASWENHPETRRIGDRRSTLPAASGAVSRCARWCAASLLPSGEASCFVAFG